MKAKTAVKIIKRQAREQPTENIPAEPVQLSRPAAREMAETVSSWITEFQRRRAEENHRDLRALFNAG